MTRTENHPKSASRQLSDADLDQVAGGMKYDKNYVSKNVIDARGGSEGVGDDLPRRREAHAGADAVTAIAGGAQAAGKLLRQPALHAASGNGHALGCHRIRQRLGK